MEKSKGKNLLEELKKKGLISEDVKQDVNSEIEKHLKEKLNKKEQKNNKLFKNNLFIGLEQNKTNLKTSIEGFTF